jgi:DNA-binding beta-propeller fold protein YncE
LPRRPAECTLHGYPYTVRPNFGGNMHNKRATVLLPALVGILVAGSPLAAQKVEPLDRIPDGYVVRILQSNNAGDVHAIIDPVANEVVARLEGCPRAHNIFAHPDGTFYYCTNETDATLDVWDAHTLQMVERIPLTARPNKAAYNKANHRIYVGIAGAPFVDVIDLDSHERLESIPVSTGIHNVYVSMDGKWVVAGLNGRDEGSIEVIDPSTNQVVRNISIEHPDGTILRIRPGAFLNGPDGSVDKFLAQGEGFNGVFVIDWETGVTERVLMPPRLPAWRQSAEANQGAPMHGLEVLPDGSAVWASSRLDSRIYGWSLPNFDYIGAVEVGPAANWMTPTPDSKRMYVAVSGADYTLAVDLERLEVIGKMTVGAGPKRIDTAVMPIDPGELARQAAQR